MSSGRDRVVEVGPVAVERTGACCRVSAAVDGVPLWFESPDVELSPAPEAFGSALLVPALHARARLRLAEPVDAVWSANVRQIRPVLRRWWRYSGAGIEAHTRAAAQRGGEDLSAGEDVAAALFFSAGVDSFHRLLRGSLPVHWLVTLEGFDYPLAGRPRAEEVEASLRRVAAVTGKRPVLVRTNAREHPLVAGAPWIRVYGGIMAGVGHLLSPNVRSVQVSASQPGDFELPNGSHWRIDPLWSSSRMSVVHVGRGERRIDKLRAIAAEPLVRDHLRVCWHNRTPLGNCSRCPKCLLAMLVLEECGELGHSRVFEGRHELAQRLDALKRTPDRAHSFEEVARSPRLDPAVAAAAVRLVARSPRWMRPDLRLRRGLVAWLRAVGLPPARPVR